MWHELQPSKPVGRATLRFHLLGEDDVDELRSVLEALRERRVEVIAKWYRAYAVRFGDHRNLSHREFAELWEKMIVDAGDALLRKDASGYTGKLLRLGKQLADYRVTLQEVVASLHLLGKVAPAVLATELQPGAETHELFEGLNYEMMILLLDAYVRSDKALVASRIEAQELEAEQLPPSQRIRFRGLVGKSAAMRRLYGEIEAAAAVRTPVTLTGEPGTEMDLVARAIHECGARADAPFVTLDSATLPADLIDAELFGYRREGFGDVTQYMGLVRSSNGGTLFLDGIDKIPRYTQKRLLRVLREGIISPAGSNDQMAGDVRIIASTIRGLSSATPTGHLDAALCRELSGIVIEVPPLRERIGDLPLVARHFIDLLSERLDRPAASISMEALEAMARYSWPGNLREFAAVLESAVVSATSPTIGLIDIPLPGGREAARYRLPTFVEAERDLIIRALEATGGNKSSAARALRISRKKLYGKLTKYGLDIPRQGDEEEPVSLDCQPAGGQSVREDAGPLAYDPPQTPPPAATSRKAGQ